MKRRGVSLLLLAVVAGTVFSQNVAITGRVTDPNGKPLTNTLVRMGVGMLYTTTDSNGFYALGSGIIATKQGLTAKGDAFPQASLAAGRLLFSLPQSDAQVRISMYGLSGRFVKDIVNGRLAKGNYAVSIENRNMANQFYLLRLTIDGVSHIMKGSSVTRRGAGSLAQSASGTEARLEKLAAIVDTLHATEPGYSLGITPIEALTGTYNFTLTKNNTWDGDTTAFWGDTSKLTAAAKKAGHLILAMINRTNGAYADSQIYWANGDGGARIRMSDQPIMDICAPAGRLYIMLGDSSKSRPLHSAYWDFEEHTCGGDGYNGNLTRVDAFGTPLAMRLHCSDGSRDLIRGEIYPVFYEPRKAIFDEFVNEVPKEFTICGTIDAPYRIPNPGWTKDFQDGGSQAHYWDAYQAACHVSAGPYVGINNNRISAGLFRHVLDLPDSLQGLWKYHYKKAPCNFYAYYLHRRAFLYKQYGFPYDDYLDWSSFITHGKCMWLLIAVGY
jgi:hypothetical protein